MCDAHVPHASCASVGGTFMYSPSPQTLTGVHWRFTDADGARVWHVLPSVQVVHAAQLVERWLCDAWYVLAGHALHVRFAVAVFADMSSPAPHVGCDTQPVERWLCDVRYVLAGHALHVRCAVLVSAEMRSPAPHVDCVAQVVDRWFEAVW